MSKDCKLLISGSPKEMRIQNEKVLGPCIHSNQIGAFKRSYLDKNTVHNMEQNIPADGHITILMAITYL